MFMWEIVAALAMGLITGWLLRGVLKQSKSEAKLQTQLEVAENQINALRAEQQTLQDKLTTSQKDQAVAETNLQNTKDRLHEQQSFLELSKKQMEDSFKALSGETLKSTSESFIKQATGTLDTSLYPLKQMLERYEVQIKELESKRTKEYGGLNEQIIHLARQSKDLATGTDKLLSALKRPEVRGSWGELQVENILKLSGASELCDFEKQVTTEVDQSRVDFLIHHRPTKQTLIIDSKVSLSALLDSDTLEETEIKRRHADSVRKNMIDLAKKEYWKKIKNSLDFVIMLVPSESFLSIALTEKPDLLEEGLSKKVVIASPMTLIVLMRLLVIGWQKIEIEENAEKIMQLNQEIYERFGPFLESLERTGTSLDNAVQAYNKAIGSFESRIEPSMTRIKNFSNKSAALPHPNQLTTSTRAITKKLQEIDATE